MTSASLPNLRVRLTRYVVSRAAALAAVAVLAAGCASHADGPLPRDSTATLAFLDTLEERTFRYFWDLTPPQNGLTPDRWPSPSFSSIAAVGFALTAYPIGVERGWVSREDAARRTLTTLSFFWQAKQDSAASGSTGYHGFFYHFLDMGTGTRYQTIELSTIDTALLLAGVLFSQSYFDAPDSLETAIRTVAESVYARVDWRWAAPRQPVVAMGWHPESGFLDADWRGYNEAMILYLLALGSPAHAVDSAAWGEWAAGYRWGEYYGQAHVGFAPLFGHQYSHVWIDFRGIQDPYMRAHGMDYFENSRRATYAQRAYATEDPAGWKDYGSSLWGLTACDGPANTTLELDGRTRAFHTYWARGADFTEVPDDGTLAPTAAGGSVAFAPEIAIPALIAMRERYGDRLFSQYGFKDAFNPTFTAAVPVERGTVDPQTGWTDVDYLGIDQGPILGMIENYRTGLIWRVMRGNPHIVRGLKAAGFTGGWLAGAP